MTKQRAPVVVMESHGETAHQRPVRLCSFPVLRDGQHGDDLEEYAEYLASQAESR